MLEYASRGGGGCLLPGRVSAPGGVSVSQHALRLVSQHALRQTPPVNRMTNRCKNITLATTSLRPVIRQIVVRFPFKATEIREDQ